MTDITLKFDSSASESDVEQKLILPLLKLEQFLGIPTVSIRTKHTLEVIEIDKGTHKRRYVPDYVIYSDALPVLVVEAKRPNEDTSEGFREAQLYAHELNKRFPAKVHPANFVISTNGKELKYGYWESKPAGSIAVSELRAGAKDFQRLKDEFGWENLQHHAIEISKALYTQDFRLPYEELGANRVRLAKIPTNLFAEEIRPLLQRYFQSENPSFEEEIIARAYVSSDETTKYERIFETFLRGRIVPTTDKQGIVLETTKTEGPQLTGLFRNLKDSKNRAGYLQLIIGSVGAGKTTFLKRYFDFLLPKDLAKQLVITYIDFNKARDDLVDLEEWIAERFVENISSNYEHIIKLDDLATMRSVFNVEIKANTVPYRLLEESNPAAYKERLANDFLKWMEDKTVFSRALARNLGGDRNLGLVVVFDNVDRRDRESQLKIFQTAQWFKDLTKSLCLVSLRDETFENYKKEPPLDAFINSNHFYIQPPRFVDMVRRRLDLAIEYLVSDATDFIEYNIEGLGRVKYPKTKLGEFLNAVYLDLFRKKRKITMILEGLAGKNVRDALDMFSAILTSGHLDTRDLTSAVLTRGFYRLQEANIIKALMRTNYMYFFDGHGFIYNVFDFPAGCTFGNHVLKFELLDFLIENRKKHGDVGLEGYFSAGFFMERFIKLGFPENDVLRTLEAMLNQGLIVADHMRTSSLVPTDLVKVHASGFIHARVLASRVDYISAAALVTALSNPKLAERIGALWNIGEQRTDISRVRKNEISAEFLDYLLKDIERVRSNNSEYRRNSPGADSLAARIREGLGFQARRDEQPVSDQIELVYDSLFTAESVADMKKKH